MKRLMRGIVIRQIYTQGLCTCSSRLVLASAGHKYASAGISCPQGSQVLGHTFTSILVSRKRHWEVRILETSHILEQTMPLDVLKELVSHVNPF